MSNVLCRECKVPFVVTPSMIAKGRGCFCSRQCQRAHGALPEQYRSSRPCATCGTSFIPKLKKSQVAKNPRMGRFCSQSCQRKAGLSHISLEQRFFEYLGRKSPNGCIIWNGHTSDFGYGRLTCRGRTVFAHRLSYELFIGPIDADMCVLHKCDNPPCVNPLHLVVGTHADNVADKVSKGRHIRGDTVPASKLTSVLVAEIRAKYASERPRCQDLADSYGVSVTTIQNVVARRTWRHV